MIKRRMTQLVVKIVLMLASVLQIMLSSPSSIKRHSERSIKVLTTSPTTRSVVDKQASHTLDLLRS